MRPPAPIPAPLLRTALRQEGLLSARQCDEQGVDHGRRARLVRSGRLLAVQRGVLDAAPTLTAAAPARLVVDPAQRRRRAAWLALLATGQDAIAVGACALALLGVEGLPQHIRPEAALPGASHRRPRGSVVVRSFDAGMPVVVVRGARVAPPLWALAQAVCELDRDHAVALLDSALHRRLLPRGVDPVRHLLRGRRGAASVRPWLDLADARSASPLETWARLQCHDAGVGPDELQVPVRRADGRVVARGDLGWWMRDGRLLVVELDGVGPHGTPDALFRDRARQNAITATGRVDLLRFTARDVLRGDVVAPAVAAHLARA
ncbi:hypothetical protein [Cellulomonas telluris]|uniref:hypothetical protein n=2 Tax=Cellulomonas TaxID=1707 RepID=UPI0010A78A42|nr:hypothetical protein [Cellulomonas telluris]